MKNEENNNIYQFFSNLTDGNKSRMQIVSQKKKINEQALNLLSKFCKFDIDIGFTFPMI